MDAKHSTHIRSFILRAWNDEVDEQKPARWRYILLDATSAERWGFTSLDQLFTTLTKEISSNAFTPAAYAEIMREVEALLGVHDMNSVT